MLELAVALVLKGVTCFGLSQGSLYWITDSALHWNGLTFSLPGACLCSCGPFIGISVEGNVSLYELSKAGLMRFLYLGSFPLSSCSFSSKYLAINGDGFSRVYDLKNDVYYDFMNVNKVKVFDDSIVAVRGRTVSVYTYPSGFTIGLKSEVDDVYLDNSKLFVCANDGLYVFEKSTLIKKLPFPCTSISLSGNYLVLTYQNVLRLFSRAGLQLLKYKILENTVRKVEMKGNDLYVLLSDGTFYHFKIFDVQEGLIMVILLVPLATALVHLAVKAALRD